MNDLSHTPFDFHAALGSNQYTLDQINWHPHHTALYAESMADAHTAADSGVVVTPASFQNCPNTYTTSRLLFQKSHHTYDSFFRSELLHLSATASLCASIAFVCLHRFCVLTGRVYPARNPHRNHAQRLWGGKISLYLYRQ